VTIAPERSPTHSELPAAAEALIREARQRQRRRRRRHGITFVVVVALVVLAFEGAGSGRPVTPGGAAGSPTPLVIPSPSQIHAEALAYFFPTSAADFTASEKFVSLINALTAKRQATCLTRAGFPSSISVIPPGDGMGDNTEFPDTSRISASGLNSGSQQSGGADLVSTGPWAAGRNAQMFEGARARCEAVATAFYAPLNTGTAGALQQAWQSMVVPEVDKSQAFTRALSGWSSCMKRGGVDVTTLDGFFTYADRQAQSGSPSAALGELFGRCLAPAESLRVHLRQSARVAFITEHASDISALSALVNRLVG